MIKQDTYANTDYIASQTGTEVSGGVLQNTDIGGSNLYQFDGVNDYLNSSTLPISNSATVYSVSCWVRFDSEIATASRVFCAQRSTTDANPIIFQIYVSISDNTFWFYIRDNAGNARSGSSGIIPEMGKIYHVVLTRNGSDIHGYINDELVLDSPAGGTLGATTCDYFSIGAGYKPATASWEWFCDGFIDEVATFTKELSASEVHDLYLRDKNPSTSGLSGTHWWRMADLTDDIGSITLTNNGAVQKTFPDVYSPEGKTLSTSKLGVGLLTAVNSFKYTSTQKPAMARSIYQFSDDNSTWKNKEGKEINNAGCFQFDGINDRAEKTIANYRSGDSSGSVSFWFKTKEETNNSRVIASSDEATTNDIWNIGFLAAGNLFMQTKVSGTSNLVKTDLLFNDDKWHFGVITSNGTTWKIYVDGIEQNITVQSGSNSGNWFADVSNRDNLTIGILHYTSYIDSWDGLLDDIAVYTDTLTQSEIISLMQGKTLPTDYNCVNWWKLDGDFTDSVGSDDLTNSGAISVTDWWKLYHVGDAVEETSVLYFDGNGDYINCGSDASLDDKIKSISAQVFPTEEAYTNSGRIIDKAHSTGNGWFLYAGSNEKINFHQYFSTTDGWWYTTEDAPVGRWVKIDVVYDNSSTTNDPEIYIDGVKQAITEGSTPVGTANSDAANDLYIGDRSALDRSWDGKIANVAVWDDARTESEIQTDFKNGYIDTSDGNLVSYWTIDEGTGSSITDNKGSNTGTLTGGQWVEDEYRPIPTIPTQETIDLSTIGASWTDFYYREYRYNRLGLYTVKTTEVTLDYSGGGFVGGLSLMGVGK